MPSEKDPNPTLYRIRVFAKNTVLAKSKFWYHMKRQHKVRKIQGEVVSVNEVIQTINNDLSQSNSCLAVRKERDRSEELRHCAEILVQD